MKIISWIRYVAFRQRLRPYLAALFYPASFPIINDSLHSEIKNTCKLCLSMGWSPQTAASLIVTIYMRDFIRNNLTDSQRAEFSNDIMLKSPKTLVEEMEWMQSIVKPNFISPDPFVFRYNFIGGVLTSWLVKERSIDLYTKSLFAEVTALAITDHEQDIIHKKMSDIVQLIGTTKS